MGVRNPSLYLLDGYSLIYRSYFAFLSRPLINSRGENTSVVFGFFRSLFSFFDRYNPERFAVVLDSPVPTFRHERYPEYKATREKAPQDLHAQVPVVLEILKVMGIPTLRLDRFEADDIIAEAARRCRAEGRGCRILTGDKDLLQLVDPQVKVLRPEKEGYRELGPGDVKEVWGVEPRQIVDYLALVGDSSDNVPGVRGIGPKTAVFLLEKFDTLEGVYGGLGQLTASQRKKLEEGRESAFLSRELVTLAPEVPLEFSPDTLSVEKINRTAALPLLERQEVRSLVTQIRERAAGAVGSLDIPGAATPLFEDPPPTQPGVSRTVEPPSQAPPPPTYPKAPETVEYEAVTTEEALNRWIAAVRRAGKCAFDSETDSLDEMEAYPVGFSFSVEPGKGCYIPIRAPEPCLPEALVKEKLKGLLEDPAIAIIGQNIKYDYKVLKRWGITIAAIAFDTMIAAWLLDTQRNVYGMDLLAESLLGVSTIHFKDVVPSGQTFDTVPLEQAKDYAAEDADITLRLYEFFKERLKKEGQEELYYKTELPLVRILAEMELAGIGLNSEKMEDFGRELGQRLGEYQGEIWKLCGREFNIKSPKQLRVILFEERKLKPGKKTKTGYSTDVTVLEELARVDPVPKLILKHRLLAKLKSTYADTLPALVNRETRRIHSRFIQTGTATGRISSKEPNLQNIPIREEDGRRIRGAFVPSPGSVFLSADYSQIELVILAHLSGDPALCEAFWKGEDVHRKTASLIFDCFPDMVGPAERRIAKTINFGVMYGMSGFRLSRELHISRKDADRFIQSYFTRYAGVRRFIDATVAEAEKRGYVSTLFGRRREIRGINSRNKSEKAGAERVAVNTVIQGSGADIIKQAMLNLAEEMALRGVRSRMLLQVHDELLFEVPLEEKPLIEDLVRREMEGAYSLSVPLKASLEFGATWGAMH